MFNCSCWLLSVLRFFTHICVLRSFLNIVFAKYFFIGNYIYSWCIILSVVSLINKCDSMIDRRIVWHTAAGRVKSVDPLWCGDVLCENITESQPNPPQSVLSQPACQPASQSATPCRSPQGRSALPHSASILVLSFSATPHFTTLFITAPYLTIVPYIIALPYCNQLYSNKSYCTVPYLTTLLLATIDTAPLIFHQSYHACYRSYPQVLLTKVLSIRG